MVGAETLKQLFDEKKISVIQFFTRHPTTTHTLSEVVDETKLPLSTTHRILKDLTQKNILSTQEQKHLTTYYLSENEHAKYLSQLLYEQPSVLEEFVNKIRSDPGIQQVLLHGKPTDTRANIVVIGTNINKDAVNEEVANILEEHRYTISHLILEPEQFGMLESMGQFSGEKTVLYQQK